MVHAVVHLRADTHQLQHITTKTLEAYKKALRQVMSFSRMYSVSPTDSDGLHELIVEIKNHDDLSLTTAKFAKFISVYPSMRSKLLWSNSFLAALQVASPPLRTYPLPR